MIEEFSDVEVKPKDLEKIKEKVTISIEPKNIFYIILGIIVLLSLFFFAGYYLGEEEVENFKDSNKFSKNLIKQGFASQRMDEEIKAEEDRDVKHRKRFFRKASVIPYVKIPIREIDETEHLSLRDRRNLDTVIVKYNFNIVEEFLPPPVVFEKKEVFNIVEEFLPPPLVMKCPEEKKNEKVENVIKDIKKNEKVVIEKKKEEKISINPQGNDSIYSIQIRSYLSLKEAEDFVKKLNEKGLNSYITTFNDNDDKKWFRVRVGRFKNLDDAKKELAVLKTKEGFEESIIFSPQRSENSSHKN